MNRSHPDYLVFKKQFWQWFDSLPTQKKATFWYYKDDMAETNFYFTVYAKNQLTNDRIDIN